MKLKTKILFIILFTFFIIILSNSSVFAPDLPSSYLELGTAVERLDFIKNLNLVNEKYFDYPYFFIQNSDTFIYFFASDNPARLVPYSGTYKVRVTGNYVYYKLGYNYSLRTFNIAGSDYPYFGSIDNYSVDLANKTFYFEPHAYDTSSNFDFYNLTGDSIIFSMEDNSYPFPKVSPLEIITTQAQKEAGQKAQEIIREALKILVPVGVIIMASLVTVSLIAYFKFWRT